MIVSQHTLVAVRTVGASWWSDDLASPAPLVSPHGSGLHHASLLSVDTSHLFKEPNKKCKLSRFSYGKPACFRVGVSTIYHTYHTFINLLFVLSEPLAFFAARPTPYWKRPQIFVQPLKTSRTDARITCRPQSNAWCTDEWQPQPVQSAAHFQAHHSLTKRPTHPPYPPFASDCNKWVYWKSCVGCLKIGHPPIPMDYHHYHRCPSSTLIFEGNYTGNHPRDQRT